MIDMAFSTKAYNKNYMRQRRLLSLDIVKRENELSKERMSIAYERNKSNPKYMEHKRVLGRAQAAKRRAAHPDYYKKEKEWVKFHSLKTKVSFFRLIGNGKIQCACCGMVDIEFLTLDHLENDGSTEKRELNCKRGGWQFYNKIRKMKGFDKSRYQILCFNCNIARGTLGICPHEMRKIMGLFDE